MLKSEAVAHYGSEAALARALGIKQPSVQDWDNPERNRNALLGKDGDPEPPDIRQLQLEALSDGALKANPRIRGSRGYQPEAAEPARQQVGQGTARRQQS